MQNYSIYMYLHLQYNSLIPISNNIQQYTAIMHVLKILIRLNRDSQFSLDYGTHLLC